MSSWFPDATAEKLFTIIVFALVVSEAVNRLISWRSQLAARPAAIQYKDRGSLWVVLLTLWGSAGATFLSHVLNLGVFHNNWQYLGLMLMVFGIAFREWAVFSLGRFFTVVVTVTTGHQLIEHGPYRWLRHPSYSGLILTLVGFALALGTWVGGVLVLGISLAGFFYRARVEEQALLEALGNDYREYMQRTWRFFPGL